MGRKFYDPEPRGRIYTLRDGPETVLGMRNIHKDTDGKPIGGIGADGTRYGSRRSSFRTGGTAGTTAAAPTGSALLAERQSLYADMKQAGPAGLTPVMESRAASLGVTGSSFRRVATQIPQPPAKPPSVQTARQPVAIAPPGAPKPPAPQVASTMHGNTPRVNRLTGKPFGFQPGDPPASELVPQIATNTPQVTAPVASGAAPSASTPKGKHLMIRDDRVVTTPAPVASGPRINRITGKPFGFQPAATAPPSGKALAESNIASMGLNGAIADYQKRSAADATKQVIAQKDGQQRSKFRGAAAPVAAISGTARPMPGATFEQTAGLPALSPEKAIARRFAVPPMANPQAIGTPPPAKAPAPIPPRPSEFEQLTRGPVTAAAPQAPAPSQAATTRPVPFYKQPSGGPAFTTQQAVQERQTKKVSSFRTSKRQAYNKVWNAQPDLPVVDPQSMANKTQKSLRTFFSGHSY